MIDYLMSQGYSAEEIQTIMEECEYHYTSGAFYTEIIDKEMTVEQWVAADPYAYEGEPVDIEVFEDVPF